MKNNEHLALFVLGIGTLGITFLLLFAFSDRNPGGIPAAERQSPVATAQAAPVPQQALPQPPTPEYTNTMEHLDSQVLETFSKTASYLGRGTYDEKEHIALLERLEFYGGMTSIRPEYKKTAQDFIQDMGRLLTLKEAVARQVKLAGQISAVESDVQVHLAKGERNEAAAKKLVDRIESLYAIHGLTEDQNQKLKTSLAALKNAYKDKPAETKTASAPAPAPVKAEAPKAPKPAAPVVQAKAEPQPEPKPVAKAPAAPPAPAPVAAPVAAPAPQKTVQPEQKVQAPAPAPKKSDGPEARAVREKYYEVMTHISRYFVVKRYNQEYHEKLTADLLDIARSKDVLSKDQQDRLDQTIAKMKYIDEKYGTVASR